MQRREDDDNNELLIPDFPGLVPDVTAYVLYFVLLSILKTNNRQASRGMIRDLRLIACAWECFITQPSVCHGTKSNISLSTIPKDAIGLDRLRMMTLHSAGLSVLPKPEHPLFAVFFAIPSSDNKSIRLSDSGVIDPKIKCFEDKEAAIKFAAVNAGNMYDFCGMNLTVKAVKLMRPRRLNSYAEVTIENAAVFGFFKLDNQHVAKECNETTEPSTISRARKNSQMSSD